MILLRSLRSTIAGFAGLVFLLAAVPGLLAQEDARAVSDNEADSSSGFRYRRVFVPAERLSDVVPPDFRPIAPEEFERKLRQSEAYFSGAPLLGVSLERIELQAALSDDMLLSTKPGKFSIQHDAEGPLVLPFAPCSIAIEKAVWRPGGLENAASTGASPKKSLLPAVEDPTPKEQESPPEASGAASTEQLPDEEPRPEEKTNPKQPQLLPQQGSRTERATEVPAPLGLHDDARQDGRLGLLVRESGQLQADWSLQGNRNATGTIIFELALPPSPSKALLLDLPRERRLRIDQGVVRDVLPIDEQTQRWHIELGGAARCTLRVEPEDRAADLPPRPTVRQRDTFEFTRQHLQMRSQLEIFSGGEPLEQVRLSVEPPLQLVAARYDQQAVAWTAADDGDEHPASGEITLQLPVPLRFKGLLQITAVAPLPQGDQKLPAIRATDFAWSQGSTALWVHDPLLLERLAVQGSYQRRVDTLTGSRSGELVELEHFSPRPLIRLQISPREGELSRRQITLVRLTPTELLGQTTIDLSVQGEERFSISGLVSRDWIIDSVQSDPPGFVRDWTPEAVANDQQKLVVDLARGLTPGEPLQLKIAGRSRRSALGSPLTVADCRMVRMEGVRGTSDLLALQAAVPFQLRLGDELKAATLPTQSLPGTATEMLTQRADMLVLEASPRYHQAQVRLVRARPRYTAKIAVDALVTGEALRETFTFDCEPQASTVDRLRVYFSQPREQPLIWQWSNAADGQPFDRLRAREVMPESEEEHGQVWEVHLPRPLAEPFVVQAVCETALDEPMAVGLAALPDAAQQTGELALHGPPKMRYRIVDDQLQQLPARRSNRGQNRSLRALFRFDPLGDAQPGQGLVLLKRSAAAGHSAGLATIWKLDLRTDRLSAEQQRHLARMMIQNNGAGLIEFGLPEGGKLHDVWLDGTAVRAVPRGDQPGRFAVALSPHEPFVVLTCAFSTSHQARHLWQRIAPPPIALDLPVLSASWTLWLPPSYASIDPFLQGANEVGWRTRLFGPLAQPAAQDPLFSNRQSFRQVIASLEEQQTQQQRAAEQLLHLLARSVLPELPPGERHWGDVLERLELRRQAASGSVASAMRYPLLIHEAALWQAALLPGTVLEMPAVESQPAGSEILKRAELALVLLPRGILLTSRRFVAERSHEVTPLADDIIYALDHEVWQPSSFLEQQRGFAVNPLSVDQWNSQELLPLPWRRAMRDAATVPGWQATTVPYHASASEIRHLIAVREDAMLVLVWSAFLASCALGYRLLAVRSRWSPLLVCGTAAAALLLPIPYYSIANAAFLGALASLALRLFSRLPPGSAGGKSIGGAAAGAVSTVSGEAALCIFLLAVPGATLLAQPVPARDEESASTGQTASDRRPTYRIYIPVDGQNQPTGQPHYIPWKLWSLLDRHEEHVSQPAGQWLVEDAQYEATLRRTASGTVELAELSAVYQLRTLAPNVEVRLPLRADQVDLNAQECRLDGRPLEVRWDEAGEALVMPISVQQAYRLVLKLVPRTTREENAGAFRFQVPPVHRARLRLTLSDPPPLVTVPTARGRLQALEDQPRQLIAQLGAADVLEVRWIENQGPGEETAQIEVQELYWLRAEPDAVELDLRLKCRVLKGRMKHARLLVDRRWQLLPPESDALMRAPQIEAGQRNTYAFELKRAVSDEVTLDFRFLLSGAKSGVGMHSLPQVQTLGMQRKSALLAISIDESLAAEGTPATNGQALPVRNFTAAWGANAAPPAAAYRLPQTDPQWSQAVRPREAESQARQRLFASAGTDVVDLHYEAAVDTSAGFIFEHRLSVPPEVVVNEVSVTQEGSELCKRFWRADDGEVTLFLSKAVLGKHTVQMRGHVGTEQEPRVKIPQIDLVSAQPESSQVALYRKPLATVEARVPAKVTRQQDVGQLPESAPVEGRLVSLYESAGASASFNLLVRENQPRLGPDSFMLTRLFDIDAAWLAEIILQLDITDGMLDVIELDVPPGMPETIRLEPGVDYSFTDVPGESYRRLQIRPSEVVSGPWELRIQVPLESGTGDRLTLPLLLPVRFAQLDRYVLLPIGADAGALQWDVQGLQLITPPEPIFGALGLAGADFQAYRPLSGDLEARAMVVRRASGNPHISLSDLRVLYNGIGTVAQLATFDLAPAGIAECNLELPSDAVLVGVAVAGVEVWPEPLAERRWRIPLVSRSLPQPVQVLYQSSTPRSESFDLVLSAPRLLSGIHAIPVEQTFWSLALPATCGTDMPPGGKYSSLPAREALSLASALRQAALQPAQINEIDKEVLDDWYQAWAARVAASRQALWRESHAIRSGEKPALDDLFAEHRQLAEKLGTLDVLTSWQQGEGILGDAQHLWEATAAGGLQHRYVQMDKAGEPLVVQRSHSRPIAPWGRGAVAALIFGLGMAFLLTERRLRLAELAWQWPHVLGIAAGILWWLLLTPSFIGLGIIAAVLWRLLRSPWRKAESIPPGSTILHEDSRSRPPVQA